MEDEAAAAEDGGEAGFQGIGRVRLPLLEGARLPGLGELVGVVADLFEASGLREAGGGGRHEGEGEIRVVFLFGKVQGDAADPRPGGGLAGSGMVETIRNVTRTEF